jgi:hypothetical protein
MDGGLTIPPHFELNWAKISDRRMMLGRTVEPLDIGEYVCLGSAIGLLTVCSAKQDAMLAKLESRLMCPRWGCRRVPRSTANGTAQCESSKARLSEWSSNGANIFSGALVTD